MTDRRFCPAARGVAHDSLRGSMADARFVAGEWHRVGPALVDLCAAPQGARDRQLLHGARFCALTGAEGWVFGFDQDDGYCGWVRAGALAVDSAVTHFVASPGTHLYPAPDIKRAEVMALPLGARLRVLEERAGFARTASGFVPAGHLRPLGEWRADPVAVAREFLGTPYLWGGNSRAGIDCSGLVQVARRACGLRCAPDSDLQALMPGRAVARDALRGGDLVFWVGHVAMVTQPGWIIHANAHRMAVSEEPLTTVEARIAARGDPVLRYLRPD